MFRIVRLYRKNCDEQDSRGIIRELVASSKAKAEAKVALEGARQRTAAVNAGLNGKLDAAQSLLKLLILDEQVRARRQLSEDLLLELLPHPRTQHQGDPRLAVIQPRKPGAKP